MTAELIADARAHPAPGLAGLQGLLGSELRRWIGWRGVAAFVVSTALVNGLLLWATLGTGVLSEWRGFDLLLQLLWLFPTLGAIAVAQGAIVDERSQGTLSWVASKPVSRPAIVVAKVVGEGLGLAVVAVFVQGIAAYIWLPRVDPARGLPFVAPGFGRFMATMGVMSLLVLFFVALTVFLGTLFRQRGPVAALALVVWFLTWIPPSVDYERWTPAGLVAADSGAETKAVTAFLMSGQPLEPTSSLVVTALGVVGFMSLAAVVLSREQL